MTEERRLGSGIDPTELWQQWFEIGSKIWTDVLRGPQEDYLDPYGLYRQWFEGMESLREQMVKAAALADGTSDVDPSELWRKWFDATVESWQRSAEISREMLEITPRYIEMMEQARNNLTSLESFPKDPLELTVQWYNATSGPVSEFVHDMIEREEFLEPASRWLQNYASFYKIFRDRSEEYLRTLQLPVRSDMARLASLIVSLEDKVDGIDAAVEDLQDGYVAPATAENIEELERRLGRLERKLGDRIGRLESEVGERVERIERSERELGERVERELEERLDRVESKLDRLLTALENGPVQNGGPAATEAPEVEIRATDAARRTAQELGVDLADVEGTGAGGQITVQDVRRKGES